MNRGLLNWNLPELSIGGTGQEDHSSGNENALWHGLDVPHAWDIWDGFISLTSILDISTALMRPRSPELNLTGNQGDVGSNPAQGIKSFSPIKMSFRGCLPLVPSKLKKLKEKRGRTTSDVKRTLKNLI